MSAHPGKPHIFGVERSHCLECGATPPVVQRPGRPPESALVAVRWDIKKHGRLDGPWKRVLAVRRGKATPPPRHDDTELRELAAAQVRAQAALPPAPTGLDATGRTPWKDYPETDDLRAPEGHAFSDLVGGG